MHKNLPFFKETAYDHVPILHKNLDYFLVLIKLTCYHEEQENVDKGGGNYYHTSTGNYLHK